MLSGLGNKAFIADLMPDHPLYIPLFAPEVQAAIGRVHPDTAPALALLQAEGFVTTNEVDIFDAGPQVRARTAGVRTINQARRFRLREPATTLPADTPERLVANGALDFRATAASVIEHEDGSAVIEPEVATALQLKTGDTLWIVPRR